MKAQSWKRDDLGHLAFVAAVLIFLAWFAVDTWRISSQLQNLMLVVPVAAAGWLVGLYVATDVILRPGRSAPDDSATTDLRIPLFMLAVCAYVAALSLTGFDIATFLFLATALYLLGERSLMPVLGYSLAMTAFAVYGLREMVTVPVPTLLFGME